MANVDVFDVREIADPFEVIGLPLATETSFEQFLDDPNGMIGHGECDRRRQ